MHAAVSAETAFVLDGVTLGSNARRPRLRTDVLTVPAGTTAVLGWSGAGKTSLLNLLAGFEQPDRGSVRGPDSMAWVPQNDGLWPHCTAREHLLECGATREEADRWLAAFELGALAEVRPPTLSRGEQSRLAIARALAMKARAFVMDE